MQLILYVTSRWFFNMKLVFLISMSNVGAPETFHDLLSIVESVIAEEGGVLNSTIAHKCNVL